MRDLCDKLYLHCMDLEEDLKKSEAIITNYQKQIDELYEEIERLKSEEAEE